MAILLINKLVSILAIIYREIEFAVLTFKLEIDGKEIYDIDVLNLKCKIDGKDYLSDVRKNLGM